MSREWEQYKNRYSERPETYEAYVDVWTSLAEAREKFSGWALFSQCANAEPAKARDMPARVAEAERLMRIGGYEVGASTRRGARRWVRRGNGNPR